jgi:tRNA (cytidine56-2'-O)-methyltransferase
MLSDTNDPAIKQTVEKVTDSWGGKFSFEMGASWKKTVKDWKSENGIVVHLTAYGENIENSDVLDRIRATGKNVLVIVGCQKVPGEFFSEEVSDFNVAIGNQPHSECASLAVFLDRFFRGEELTRTFSNSKIAIMPAKRGKRIVSRKRRNEQNAGSIRK